MKKRAAAKTNENGFEQLARLVKEESDDTREFVREHVSGEIGGLRKEMHDGFAAVNRRLDQIIQTQLDEHARRIKKLETAVFAGQR